MVIAGVAPAPVTVNIEQTNTNTATEKEDKTYVVAVSTNWGAHVYMCVFIFQKKPLKASPSFTIQCFTYTSSGVYAELCKFSLTYI